jgi:uncharacterized membrane protein YeiH
MKKSILPPLHIDTKPASTVWTPSAVFTLVVVWIEAFVTFPHLLRFRFVRSLLVRVCCVGLVALGVGGKTVDS